MSEPVPSARTWGIEGGQKGTEKEELRGMRRRGTPLRKVGDPLGQVCG